MPDCFECRRLLRSICDNVDGNLPHELMVRLYYHHQAVAHDSDREIALYRSNFYRNGEPGVRKR